MALNWPTTGRTLKTPHQKKVKFLSDDARRRLKILDSRKLIRPRTKWIRFPDSGSRLSKARSIQIPALRRSVNARSIALETLSRISEKREALREKHSIRGNASLYVSRSTIDPSAHLLTVTTKSQTLGGLARVIQRDNEFEQRHLTIRRLGPAANKGSLARWRPSGTCIDALRCPGYARARVARG